MSRTVTDGRCHITAENDAKGLRPPSSKSLITDVFHHISKKRISDILYGYWLWSAWTGWEGVLVVKEGYFLSHWDFDGENADIFSVAYSATYESRLVILDTPASSLICFKRVKPGSALVICLLVVFRKDVPAAHRCRFAPSSSPSNTLDDRLNKES